MDLNWKRDLGWVMVREEMGVGVDDDWVGCGVGVEVDVVVVAAVVVAIVVVDDDDDDIAPFSLSTIFGNGGCWPAMILVLGATMGRE